MVQPLWEPVWQFLKKLKHTTTILQATNSTHIYIYAYIYTYTHTYIYPREMNTSTKKTSTKKFIVALFLIAKN